MPDCLNSGFNARQYNLYNTIIFALKCQVRGDCFFDKTTKYSALHGLLWVCSACTKPEPSACPRYAIALLCPGSASISALKSASISALALKSAKNLQNPHRLSVDSRFIRVFTSYGSLKISLCRKSAAARISSAGFSPVSRSIVRKPL